MFARTRLLQLTEAMKGKLIVVYGDIVADRFVYDLDRLMEQDHPTTLLWDPSDRKSE